MKVLPKNINFSKTAPVSVEELKDGEMLMTSDGFYARVGDQILSKALPNWAHAIAGLYVYDSIDQGHIIHTQDGTNWTGSGHLFGQGTVIRVVYCGNGIFLGFTGWAETLCLKSVDFGLTWTNLGQIDGTTLQEPYAADYLENGIVIVGDGGNAGCYLYRSIDYGDNWTNLGSQFANSAINAIGYAGNGVAIAWTTFDTPDRYLRSIDYGATWEDMGSVPGFGGAYHVIHLGNGILLTNGNSMIKSYDRGLTWENRGGPTGTECMTYLGNGIVVVGTGDDHIWRSIDYGNNWEDIGIPTGPGGAMDQINSITHLGQGIVMCGSYNDGNLGVSIDYGLNWTTIVEPVALTDWTEWMATSFPKALDAINDPNLMEFVIGKTADGNVQNYKSGAGLWATLRNDTDGISANDAQTEGTAGYASHASGIDDWYLLRTFLEFDFNIPAGKEIIAAELHARGYLNGDSGVSIQQGTQANPITTADYDSFVGSLFDFIANWDETDWNAFTFNAAGIAYLNSVSTAKFCLREYDHDYLDVAPSGTTYSNGMQYQDGPQGPYLKFWLGDATTTTTTTTTTT